MADDLDNTAPEPSQEPAAPAPAPAAPAAPPRSDPRPVPAQADPPAAPPKPPEAENPGVLSTPGAPWKFDDVPEKFRVTKDDGTPDLEKTLEKYGKSYGELEKRASRGGEVRPKTIADYKINTPEKAPFITAEDAGVQKFLPVAHRLGVTQTQLDGILEYFGTELAPALVSGAKALDAEEARTELRKVWKTDAEFTENVEFANQAAKEYGINNPDLIKQVRDNPVLIRFMAELGREIGPDSPPAGIAPAAGSSAKDFLAKNWAAYSDAKHPEHSSVSAQYKALLRKELGPDAETPIE